MIDPAELLFPGALQGTVLLMAEKRAPGAATDGVAISHEPDSRFLQRDPEEMFARARYASGPFPGGKWTAAMLTPSEREVVEGAGELPGVRRFSTVATVDVGTVTGANAFFLVSDDTLARWGLGRFARPMFGKGAQCPGTVYDVALHAANVAAGHQVSLIDFGACGPEPLPPGARAYVESGEAQSLHTRFKCRIRDPWYSVPSVPAAEMGMFKRSHHYPRLIHNTARARTTDSCYRISSLGPAAPELVGSFVNTLTALSSELEGRSYGGGVLELVPSEIERLLLPLPPGGGLRPGAIDDLIRADHVAALDAGDEAVLPACGIGKPDALVLRTAWDRLRRRRQRLRAEEDAADELDQAA